MRNIGDLHPELREKIGVLKARCAAAGLKIGIGECLRTAPEQDLLYAKGRTAAGKIVTNARGSTYSSMHQWGVAFDFYRADGKGAYDDSDGFFTRVGKIGEEIGLEWGGRWKKPTDKPHFQLPYWGSTTSKLKALYSAPENFMKIWEEKEMENNELGLLTSRVEALEKQLKVYRYTAELPTWARKTVQKLLDEGVYAGSAEDDLNLPEILMRMLVIMERRFENSAI